MQIDPKFSKHSVKIESNSNIALEDIYCAFIESYKAELLTVAEDSTNSKTRTLIYRNYQGEILFTLQSSITTNEIVFKIIEAPWEKEFRTELQAFANIFAKDERLQFDFKVPAKIILKTIKIPKFLKNSSINYCVEKAHVEIEFNRLGLVRKFQVSTFSSGYAEYVRDYILSGLELIAKSNSTIEFNLDPKKFQNQIFRILQNKTLMNAIYLRNLGQKMVNQSTTLAISLCVMAIESLYEFVIVQKPEKQQNDIGYTAKFKHVMNLVNFGDLDLNRIYDIRSRFAHNGLANTLFGIHYEPKWLIISAPGSSLSSNLQLFEQVDLALRQILNKLCNDEV